MEPLQPSKEIEATTDSFGKRDISGKSFLSIVRSISQHQGNEFRSKPQRGIQFSLSRSLFIFCSTVLQSSLSLYHPLYLCVVCKSFAVKSSWSGTKWNVMWKSLAVCSFSPALTLFYTHTRSYHNTDSPVLNSVNGFWAWCYMFCDIDMAVEILMNCSNSVLRKVHALLCIKQISNWKICTIHV